MHWLVLLTFALFGLCICILLANFIAVLVSRWIHRNDPPTDPKDLGFGGK